MPDDFNKCVNNGGRVRTVSGPAKDHGLNSGEYVRYCYLNGESYRGDVEKKGNPEPIPSLDGKGKSIFEIWGSALVRKAQRDLEQKTVIPDDETVRSWLQKHYPKE